MYTPTELVSHEGQFGGADLVQQRGTVAELAQICQAWGAAVAALHTAAVRAHQHHSLCDPGWSTPST
jgi:hypothetical protein